MVASAITAPGSDSSERGPKHHDSAIIKAQRGVYSERPETPRTTHANASRRTPFSALRGALNSVLDQTPHEGEIRVAKNVALTVVDIGVATTVGLTVAAVVMPFVVAKALAQAVTEVMTEEADSQQTAIEFCRIYMPHP